MRDEYLSDIPKQFLLSRAEMALDFPLHVRTVFGCYLYTHPSVPVISLLNADGSEAGLLLGWAAVGGGTLLSDGDVHTLPAGFDVEVGSHRSWCGRFVLILNEGDGLKVVTDAGALLPVVYDQRTRLIASSPTLLSAVSETKPHADGLNALSVEKQHGWYPFGLTPLEGVMRLLPNHVLCLKRFTATRIWPGPAGKGSSSMAGGPEVLTRELARVLARNVVAFAGQGAIDLHLTAGWDTRMVLAAAHGAIDAVRTRTFSLPGGVTKLDIDVAKTIAGKFGLRHQVIDYVPCTQSDREAWLWRAGYCVNDHVVSLGPTEEKSQTGRHAVTGTCGEVGRAFYWGREDIGTTSLSPSGLLSRLGFERYRDVLTPYAEAWLASLPVTSPVEQLDLAYVEQRLGCWAGPAVLGHNTTHPSLSPFNSLEVFELLLAFPLEERAANTVFARIIEELWPELLDIPVNRAIGIKKLFHIKSELKAVAPAWLKRKR